MPSRSFLILCLILGSTSVCAQGWQAVGPDSSNWNNVRRVSGKWVSPGSYKIAAATDKGIAVFNNPY